jgi:sorbitol-specific phosphotransferase system component IIC
MVEILAESEVVESCTLGIFKIPSFALYVASSNASSSILWKVFPMISSFFWCHMYDVLVYKMLWDRKKILNISLWKIIRLSMRPATGLCPHISLERILVYIVLV